MEVYALQTRIGLDGIARVVFEINVNTGLCKFVTDNFPGAIRVSNFSKKNENQHLSSNEFNSIINSRLRRLERSRKYGFLSVGDPDYLFSEFLERGIRCSDAVCLLERKFWIENLIDLIKGRSTKDVSEILRRLSEKLALRPDKQPGESSDRWTDTDKKVSEALQLADVKRALDNLLGEIQAETDADEKLRKGTIYVPVATGFMIGKNYLMTNFHVFNDQHKEEINDFVARFRYQRNVWGQEANSIYYQLNPENCISDEDLDFTIVEVKEIEDYESKGLKFSHAGENFGWLPMLDDPTLVAPPIQKKEIQDEAISQKVPVNGLAGEPVFIIQHPQGAQKRIVLFNNSMQEIYQSFFRYEADADFGSSGSCILNQNWQLVGIHHSTLIKLDENQQEPEVYGNLGTRVCSIIDFLKEHQDNHVAKDLLNNRRYIVKEGEQPLHGKINILIGYHRTDASHDHVLREQEITQFLLDNIAENLNSSFQIVDVLKSVGTYEKGLKFLSEGEGYQQYQNGDVAVDIRINCYPEDSEHQQKITIYYSHKRSELKASADILLKKLLNPRLAEGNSQPVDMKSDSALEFCNLVNMPALIIKFDFYGRSFEDVTREINPPPIVQYMPYYITVCNALEDWVKVNSPIGYWSQYSNY